jgi:hypothetical protein
VRRWTLIDLGAAFLLPLVPALLLYGLFNSQNSAVYDKAGLKLGGPAALYFALLLLALRYVSRWRPVSDPLEKLKKVLVGAWDIESRSAGSRRVATSIATFGIEDDELRLSGGSIKEQGEPIGSWSPDRLILDRERDGVIYVYELIDVNSTARWRGLMELTLVRTATPICMEGTWEVIGPDYHRGTVTFSKRPSSS